MFVPAWSATDPSRQSRKARGEKLPATMAQALPTRTGMMLAVNENGRVARYQITGQAGRAGSGAPLTPRSTLPWGPSASPDPHDPPYHGAPRLRRIPTAPSPARGRGGACTQACMTLPLRDLSRAGLSMNGVALSGTALGLQQAVGEQPTGGLGVGWIDVPAHIHRRCHTLRHEEVVELLKIGGVDVAIGVMIRQAAGRDRGGWDARVLFEDGQVVGGAVAVALEVAGALQVGGQERFDVRPIVGREPGIEVDGRHLEIVDEILGEPHDGALLLELGGVRLAEQRGVEGA